MLHYLKIRNSELEIFPQQKSQRKKGKFVKTIYGPITFSRQKDGNKSNNIQRKNLDMKLSKLCHNYLWFKQKDVTANFLFFLNLTKHKFWACLRRTSLLAKFIWKPPAKNWSKEQTTKKYLTFLKLNWENFSYVKMLLLKPVNLIRKIICNVLYFLMLTKMTKSSHFIFHFFKRKLDWKSFYFKPFILTKKIFGLKKKMVYLTHENEYYIGI